MRGIAVVPVGGLGGGARTVWEYGSSKRKEFYLDHLDDARIDRLTSPWSEAGATAALVVKTVEGLAGAAARAQMPGGLLTAVFALALLTAAVVVGCVTVPLLPAFDQLDDAGVRLVVIFVSVSAGGTLGGAMQTLRSVRDGLRVSWRSVGVDLTLGIAAGIVSAMLYLLAQVAVTGGVDIALFATDADFIRVCLMMSLVSVFASLYLDAALARFDRVKEQVIRGSYGDE